MIKCEKCNFGRSEPIPNEEIGHEGRYIENWECDHPDLEIRKRSKQKGWADNCPEFEQRVE